MNTDEHQPESDNTAATLMRMLAEYREAEVTHRRAERLVERAIHGDGDLRSAQAERDTAEEAARAAHDAIHAVLLDLRHPPAVEGGGDRG